MRKKASILIEVDMFAKVTRVYLRCGARVELSLSDGEFACPSCGSRFDENVVSALTTKKKGYACGIRAERATIALLRVVFWSTSSYCT